MIDTFFLNLNVEVARSSCVIESLALSVGFLYWLYACLLFPVFMFQQKITENVNQFQ